MPRNTRAAARAQEPDIEIATDETQTEVPTPLAEDIKNVERPALVELTANAVDEIEVAIEMKADFKKSAKKARATSKKGTKKAKAKQPSQSVQQSMEVVEDQASGSETGPDADTIVSADESPVTLAENLEAEQPATPELNALSPQTSGSIEQAETEAAQKLESLFKQPEKTPKSSPLENIAAVASAIKEDPPALNTAAKVSPKGAQSKKTKKSTAKPPPTATKASTLRAKTTHNPEFNKPRSSTVKMRPSLASKGPPSNVKARPSTGSPVKKDAGVPKDSTQKKRSAIAALNTPPPPVKSAKPTTTSTFKLPGEALQEKFKAQREERLKRQEEQAQKQKDLAVRPTIPPKHTTKPRAVPEVKLNKASAARMSMSNTLKERPNGRMTPAAKRPATLRVAHRPSLSVSSGNTVKRPANHARSVSATSKSEIAQPTPLLTATEKAEAAKKARAEAAERGRLASKAWAEKKQKGAEAKKAVAKANATVESKEESKENAAPASAIVETA